jgi:hypothetical protein
MSLKYSAKTAGPDCPSAAFRGGWDAMTGTSNTYYCKHSSFFRKPLIHDRSAMRQAGELSALPEGSVLRYALPI